jgi:DNA-binding PadR family transcriptional regulator
MSNAEHLERVCSTIQPLILEFCAGRREFHMTELADFVQRRAVFVAPDSASRILRKLRHEGLIQYTVVDRRASRYRIEEVAHATRP